MVMPGHGLDGDSLVGLIDDYRAEISPALVRLSALIDAELRAADDEA